jgi:hypothetical protein
MGDKCAKVPVEKFEFLLKTLEQKQGKQKFAGL